MPYGEEFHPEAAIVNYFGPSIFSCIHFQKFTFVPGIVKYLNGRSIGSDLFISLPFCFFVLNDYYITLFR